MDKGQQERQMLEINSAPEHNQSLKIQLQRLQTEKAELEQCIMNLSKVIPSLSEKVPPLSILQIFAGQYTSMAEKVTEQSRHEETLDIKIKQLQFNAELILQRCLRAERKCQEQDEQQNIAGAKKRQMELFFLEEIKQLRKDNQTALAENERFKKELELQNILRKEEGRITFSAAIHHTQMELERARIQCEQEFQSECEALLTEMKEKDEKFRLTLRKLHAYHKESSQQSDIEEENYLRIIAFIRNNGSIQQLNETIHKLKGELLNIRKEARERQAQILEAKYKQKKIEDEIIRLTLELEKTRLQKRDIGEDLTKSKLQLEKERAQIKQLEAYFSQKWLKEFEIVRANLERAFSSRLLKVKNDYEAKITAIENKQQTYLIRHQKDEKVINTLEEEVVSLQEEVKVHQEIIVKLEVQKEEFKQEAKVSHKLIAELEQTASKKSEDALKQKQKEIEQLKQLISSSAAAKEVYEQKLIKIKRNLKEGYESEKKSLEIKLAKQKQDILKTKERQFEEFNKKHHQEMQKQKVKEQSLKHQHQLETITIQARHKKVLNQSAKLLEQSRISLRQAYNQAESKQKLLANQIQQVKKHYSKESEKFKKEMDEKNSSIRILQQRSRHDQTFKKEMRYLLDLKIKDCGQLAKENERLSAELIQKEAELVQLNNILLNNDWKEVITQLRAQFRADLFALNEIHWKQMQISRNKLHELQGILYCKHAEDEQILRSLFQHNEMLETRLELIEKKKTEGSDIPVLPLTSVNFVQSRRNLFLSKRRKRNNFNFSQTIKPIKQSSTAAAIIRMKRFLERGKSTDAKDVVIRSDKIVSPLKSRYNYRQISER